MVKLRNETHPLAWETRWLLTLYLLVSGCPAGVRALYGGCAGFTGHLCGERYQWLSPIGLLFKGLLINVDKARALTSQKVTLVRSEERRVGKSVSVR